MFTTQKFIFKYAPVNIFTLQSLINNELYFSAPKNFNDPRDCDFKLITDPPIEGVISFYESLNLSQEETKVKIGQFQINKQEFFDDIQKEFNYRLKSEYGVTCFSEDGSNKLMWAHYASQHKGICLMFDWQIHKEFFMGYKVQYDETLPQIVYNGDGQLEVNKIFLTKLKDWSYESEVRAVVKLDNNSGQLAAFNPQALKGIIWGERIAPIDKKTITNLLEMHPGYVNIQFFDEVTS